MSLTEKYVEFAKSLKIKDIPSEVRDRVCEFILDTIGVGIGGSGSGPATISRKCVATQTNLREATLWGTREFSSISGAAFVNGTASHAYDYDDTHNWAEIHISSVIVPCLVAMAEKYHLPGYKLIETYTAAYEVTARIGVIVNPKILYAKGLHCTGLGGPFGSSLVAGLLMGLNKNQLINALGIAGSYSSGLLAFQYDGSMTKRFHPGIASSNGISAAILANEGFTGPYKIIEGEKGYIKAFSGDLSNINLATKGLGSYFEILENHVKIYACVSGFSAPIECLLIIMDEHKLTPEDIDHIDVEVRELTYMWVRPPEEIPKNVLSAQMNLAYCLAVAAYDKQVKLAQFAESKICDYKLHTFMSKIKIRPSQELTDLNKTDSVCLPGRVTVRTKNGNIFIKQLNYAKDSRGNRASLNELVDKFTELTVPYIGKNSSSKIIELVQNLEKVDDTSQIFALCRSLT